MAHEQPPKPTKEVDVVEEESEELSKVVVNEEGILLTEKEKAARKKGAEVDDWREQK
jgi:hypothetical protein